MKSFLQSLAAPNSWVAVLASVAVVGVGCEVTGLVIDSSFLCFVGFWLVAPLLVLGFLVVVVVIPYLTAKNRQAQAAFSLADVLVRLWRKTKDGAEELGWLVAGAVPGALRPAGRLWPVFAMLQTRGQQRDSAAGATYQLTLPLTEEGLSLALLLRRHDADQFDLQATAVAEAASLVEIRLEIEGGGLPAPVVLVSNDWGDFFSEQGAPGRVSGLRLGAYQLRVRVPGREEEFEVNLPDVRELCRLGLEQPATHSEHGPVGGASAAAYVSGLITLPAFLGAVGALSHRAETAPAPTPAVIEGKVQDQDGELSWQATIDAVRRRKLSFRYVLVQGSAKRPISVRLTRTDAEGPAEVVPLTSVEPNTFTGVLLLPADELHQFRSELVFTPATEP